MPSDGHIWILGATGYVGRALGIEAMKEYPPRSPDHLWPQEDGCASDGGKQPLRLPSERNI